MLDLNELENTWIRYKIKSYIPHAVIALSIAVVIFIIFSVNFNSQNNEIVTNTPPDSVKEEIVTQHKSKSNDKMLMSPSLDFINSMHKSSPKYYDPQNSQSSYVPKEKKIYKKEPVIEKKPIVKEEVIVKSEPVVKEEVVVENEPVVEVGEVKTEVVKESVINIKRKTSKDDIQYVIDRFKVSHNPSLSLFIAKKYYDQGNYNQSYNYSLITNEIDSNLEESWIIFSKSLLKLNKKQKAIQTLQKYINQSHSSRAQLLLDNIKSGKIK